MIFDICRQQERHLGLVPGEVPLGPFGLSRTLRSPHGSDSLKVTIHNVTTPSAENGESKILYWVRVRGRPVPATTAARDMRLVSDAEVAAELGLPVLLKAERKYTGAFSKFYSIHTKQG